jgi:glycerate kinase
MSLISGLALLKDNERDILNASTFGLGSVIIHALNKGITRFIIGIGGSATNDAGAGMLQALGYSLKDKSGRELSHGAAPLAGLAAIIPNNIHKALKKAAFTIACDVNNPLLGKRGASAIFGPQKGAKASQIPILENSLKNLADVIKNSGYVDCRNSPGSGAAGGIGYVFKSLLKAELIPGAQLLLNECNFYQNAKKADLIITAEGALDSQTADGKLPMYICQAGRQAGVPVIAIAGKLDTGWSALKPHGLTAAFSLTPGPVSLQASIANASTYLQNTAQEIISVFINSKRQYIPEATCI